MTSNVCTDYSVFYEYTLSPQNMHFYHTDKAFLPSRADRYRTFFSNRMLFSNIITMNTHMEFFFISSDFLLRDIHDRTPAKPK